VIGDFYLAVGPLCPIGHLPQPGEKIIEDRHSPFLQRRTGEREELIGLKFVWLWFIMIMLIYLN
jgi:hypothetical protein